MSPKDGMCTRPVMTRSPDDPCIEIVHFWKILTDGIAGAVRSHF